MNKIALTRKAAASLYSSPASVIVSDGVVRKYFSIFPDNLTCLVLHSSGLIACCDEKVKKSSDQIPFLGTPYGLIGFVVLKRHKAPLTNLLSFIAEQKPAFMPQAIYVTRWGIFDKAKALTMVSQFFAKQCLKNQTSLMEAQHQLVHLRTENEVLGSSLEKARRMITGMGFSVRNICADISPDNETVAPLFNDGVAICSQILPVDLANFTGISLYVIEESDGTDGELTLIIRRQVDDSIVCVSKTPYSAFKKGWHVFAMPETTSRTFGDGVLQLHWAGVGGPCFAKAKPVADRFGDKDGLSLAMRVECGLANAAFDADLNAVSERFLVRTHLSADALFEQGSFLGGQNREQEYNETLGDKVLKLDHNKAWIQTHSLNEGISGFHIPEGLGVAVKEARARVTLPHVEAIPCIAVLLSGPSQHISYSGCNDVLNRIVNMQSLPLVGGENDIYWSAKVVGPGCTEDILLSFDKPLDIAQDLVLAVMSMEQGKAYFGWCRWHNVSVAQSLPIPKHVAEARPEKALLTESNKPHIRVVKFPEIVDQIAFYRGENDHVTLKESLGYWPVEFSDDTGAMQLNPFDERVCATVLKAALPANVRRITCEVGTSHQQADTFIYILGVYPEIANCANAIETVGDTVASGVLEGVLSDGTQWSSITLKALEKQTVALSLEQPVKAGAGVFFAVMPAVMDQSEYGWCRWYSLSFETVGGVLGASVLQAERNNEGAL